MNLLLEQDPTAPLDWVPAIAVAAFFVLIWYGLRAYFFKKLGPSTARSRMSMQLIPVALCLLAMLVIVLVLPVTDTMRQQMIAVLGLVFTGVIGLASATFVGNAMAGLMLRAVRNFKPGDFLRVGNEFGRVTELGLLHTELQTPERDLTTLPNLYLVTNPVTVVRSSGTVVSAELSLGYDVPRQRIEEALLKAAESAGLTDAFVHILELGDFSVVYRISGFLEEVKLLISTRSKLRAAVLDEVHGAGIEIVSPNFMNQRVFPKEASFIPEKFREARRRRQAEIEASLEDHPEAKIFDKAEDAGGHVELTEALKAIEEEMAKLKQTSSDKDSTLTDADVAAHMEVLNTKKAEILAEIQMLKEHIKGSD